MPIAWKILFLPKNFPKTHALRNYVFGHNKTHSALVLDYGSVLNHHESFNVQAGAEFPGSDYVNFLVRTGFVCANSNTPKVYSMHAYTIIS